MFQSPGPSSSFLSCVVCGLTPPGPPLHGCDSGHLVCAACRDMGGALLSCPRCGSGNLNIRQTVAEELLLTELDRNRLVFCPYKVIKTAVRQTQWIKANFICFSLLDVTKLPAPD